MQRLVDLIVAAMLSVVAAPLAVLVAIIVALTLGRPLLFRQVRSGAGGRPFTLVKFRTMRLVPGDDAERTPTVGRWLRRSRLDELPQLVNILRGDMAFVGPRPLLPETIAAWGADGSARGAVRPGLTGWAQVHGNTRLSNHEKLALDLWYIENRTLILDLSLLARTVGVVLFGEHANRPALERAHASSRRRRS
ncbi:sugar transferase [Glacieibacterium sp.]|uniref:sugar transferase n=1 Tax=Glacieibacterium sp. TaxID=2860237 RepID=UPI003AFFC9E3